MSNGTIEVNGITYGETFINELKLYASSNLGAESCTRPETRLVGLESIKGILDTKKYGRLGMERAIKYRS